MAYSGGGETGQKEDSDTIMKFSNLEHSYTFFNTKVQASRTLRYQGIDMTGLVDLTSFRRATGEAMWPCCRLLADYLSRHFQIETHGNQILELGCGLGLLGAICAAKLGSEDDAGSGETHKAKSDTTARVVLSDGNWEVLERCIANAKQNYLSSDCQNISYQILQWGDHEQQLKLLQQLPGEKGFSLILASDVIYERESVEKTSVLLAQTVDFLLNKEDPNARFLLSFQLRSADVGILYKAFAAVGFDHFVPSTCDCSDIESDDEILCFEDVYGERHDEMTMFTDKFVVAFVRKQNKNIAS